MDIQEAFDTALSAEHESEVLYRGLAEQTEDDRIREIFSYLADEEKSHYAAINSLKKLYGLQEGDNRPVLPQRKFDIEALRTPIVTEKLKQDIKSGRYESSTLAFAVQLEKNGVDHYAKIAKQVEDTNIKTFFESLSRWEQDHHDFLENHFENINKAAVRKNE
ncbi:MAG: ferritin family protein [Spirochaetia bacterium]